MARARGLRRGASPWCRETDRAFQRRCSRARRMASITSVISRRGLLAIHFKPPANVVLATKPTRKRCVGRDSVGEHKRDLSTWSLALSAAPRLGFRKRIPQRLKITSYVNGFVLLWIEWHLLGHRKITARFVGALGLGRLRSTAADDVGARPDRTHTGAPPYSVANWPVLPCPLFRGPRHEFQPAPDPPATQRPRACVRLPLGSRPSPSPRPPPDARLLSILVQPKPRNPRDEHP